MSCCAPPMSWSTGCVSPGCRTGPQPPARSSTTTSSPRWCPARQTAASLRSSPTGWRHGAARPPRTPPGSSSCCRSRRVRRRTTATTETQTPGQKRSIRRHAAGDSASACRWMTPPPPRSRRPRRGTGRSGCCALGWTPPTGRGHHCVRRPRRWRGGYVPGCGSRSRRH